MERLILNNLWAIWNGAGLSFVFGIGIDDPKWWYFTIPLCILIGIRK